jgi:Putative hemolysin
MIGTSKKTFIFGLFLAFLMNGFSASLAQAEEARCARVFSSNYFRNVQQANSNPGIAVLMKLIGINKLEQFYDRLTSLPPADRNYWSEVIQQMNVKLHYSKNQQLNIPQTGGLVVVSNHPFGGVDGLSILAMLKEVRSDVKILMTDAFGDMLPEIATDIIGVNLSGSREARKQNLLKIEEIRQWVAAGHVIVIFPAGEISRVVRPFGPLEEIMWKPTAMKIARETGAGILPLYFEGQNSAVFQAVSTFSRHMEENKWGKAKEGSAKTTVDNIKGGARGVITKLREAAIVANITNKMNKDVVLHIGDVVPAEVVSKFTDDALLTEFIRQRSNELAGEPRIVQTEELLQELDFVKGTKSSVRGRTPEPPRDE